MKLGKPKYEQGNKNYFSFKKDTNSFILRILPPMGKLADAGKWSLYHRVEFGYVGTDGRMKPFLSPRKVNFDKMVEVESEAYLRRELLKTQNAQARAGGNDALVAQTDLLIKKFNQDAKHYMNAVDLNGNVGLFKIGHRGFQALKAELDRLRSEGVDPVGIENGRYFVFSRSGKGRDTIYTVLEYKQKVEIEQNGQKFVVDKPFPHSINEAILSKLATDAFELEDVYPSVTTEQEKLILTGPEGVDKVFTKRKASESVNPASTAAAQQVAQEALPEELKTEVPVTQETLITEPNSALEKAETVGVSPEASTATSGAEIVSETVLETTSETPVETVVTGTPPAGQSEADFFKMIEEGKF